MPWLLVHLVATVALAGIGWMVQIVVYPAFALVDDTQWPRYHRAHQRATALVVTPPWLVQGVAVVALALDHPAGTALSAVAALGMLALTGVLLTALVAVPAHARLAERTAPTLRRLLVANLARTLAWTASAALSALLLWRALPSSA